MNDSNCQVNYVFFKRLVTMDELFKSVHLNVRNNQAEMEVVNCLKGLVMGKSVIDELLT
jgi:hypothetical protein